MEPIFCKFVKRTDVESRLSVPAKCLKKFPSFQGRHIMDLRVKDERGSFSRFRCSIRKRRHPKPVLAGDWHKFAVSKRLQTGDEVTLFKVDDQATGAVPHYRVGVRKLVNMRLFGAFIDYAPLIIL